MILLSLSLLGLTQGLPTGTIEGQLRGSPRDLQDAMVYLEPVAGPTSGPTDSMVIDQRGLRFWPRVAMVPVGGTVLFRNSDPILHNVFSPGRAEGFDLGTYPRPEYRPHTFVTPGVHIMLCHIHPEMAAYILVVPGGMAGELQAGGRFRFEGVPTGRYRLVGWRPRREPVEMDMIVVPGVQSVELDLTSARRRR